jgi:hypothetical protein
MFCEFRFRTGLRLNRFNGPAEKVLPALLFFVKIKKAMAMAEHFTLHFEAALILDTVFTEDEISSRQTSKNMNYQFPKDVRVHQ